MSIRAFPKRGELARRVSGGLEITLYWNEVDDTTSVELRQQSTGETLTFSVPRDRALAFHHPFAHVAAAAWLGWGEVA
jgi:hypothetical protein